MKSLILFISFLSVSILLGQQPRKIEFVHSDLVQRIPNLYDGNIIFSGNVEFRHEGSILHADTVIYFEKDNSVIARSRANMNFGDTVNLSSRYLEYNGNTRKAYAKKNVVLKDRTQTLETQELIYDRNSNKAYFDTRSKITQNANGNILYSNHGVYDLTAKTTTFDKNVDLSTPEYQINSSNLIYYPNGKTNFNGPTTISQKSNPKNHLYTEQGEYNTQTEEAYLRKNSKIYSNGKILSGDLLYFNQKTQFGWGKGRVLLDDPEEKRQLRGGYGEYYQAKDSAIIVDKPYAIKAFKVDSMYISADTIIAKRNVEKISTLYAFHKVRMYKTDMQAKCDSLYFRESVGQMDFYHDPVFWSTIRQITGDTIMAYMNVKQQILDSINVFGHGFAMSKTDSLTEVEFNQIKGRFIHGLVNNNELRYVKVLGNAESIVYVDDEDKQKNTRKRIGINKILCGIIEADFYERQVNIVECNINGQGKLYPLKMIPIDQRYLKDFVWRERERLKKWRDIFEDIPYPDAQDLNPGNVPTSGQENTSSLE